MASLLTVRLLKGDSPSWGFRLQGGKDFGTPLVIQKVIVGSPAERAGLVAGDSVIRVNQTDVFNLRHKDAQDVLLRAGNSFDMTIQRGGSTWKPSVIPTGHISTPSPTINNISPVTRTSLAAKPTEDIGAIGTGHNVSAKPFLNGTLNGGPKLVNTQYNSPLKLYSEESIAETLSAQTEVLSTGALGVNFKKNEKNYDASKSAVLSLLKEEESSPRTPDHTEHHLHNSGIDSAPSPVVAAGLRHVAAPENKPQPPSPQLPPGQNICADCERLIVGVFVRIKDKNLHVECFKCSTCGSSLKNVGYYNINNKLYCDIHAKLAARNNPPAPNLVPVTVPPGGRAPVNAISAALASHPYPTAAPLSPKTNSYQPSLTGPRPFGSVPGPLSPSSNLLTKTAAPLSPVAPVSAPTYSPISSTVQIVSNVVWPPVQEEPELPSACPLFYPPPSQFTVKPRKRNNSEDSNHSEIERINAMEQNEYERINEMCFASGRRSATECAETIAKTVGRQMLVETIIRSRPQSPPQSEHKYAAQPELEKKEELVESVSKPEKPEEPAIDFCKIEQRSTPSKIENPVPKKWESQMLQALTISVDDTASKTISYSKSSEKQTEIIASEDTNILENTFSNIPTKKTSTPLGSALSVAPREPFNPVKSSVPEIIPLPEETVPYFPPENLFVVPIEKEGDSQKPGKKKKDPNLEKLLEDLPKPQQKLSMLAALTTAPDRAFTPSSFETITTEESATSQTSIEKSETETKCTMSKTTKNEQVRPKTLPQAVTIQQETDLTPSPECLPLFQGFTCSFQNKADISQFDIQISTSPMRDRKAKKEKDASKKLETQKIVAKECEENVCSIEKVSTSKEVKVKETTQKSTEKQKQKTIIVKPSQMTSLRKAEELPQYQKSLQQNAEADLIMMERMERAKLRKEQEQQKAAMQTMQNTQTSQSQVSQSQVSHAQIFQERKMEQASVMCPVITVQEGNHHHPDNSFKPVIESRPPSCAVPTSTPRPLTPSMINKPPPIIPYYQANLVAQKHGPAIGHLLNPRSPGVSRTPSPLPETHKTSLGVGGKSSNIRPKSPAQGPPTNPLQEPSIPTRLDFKLDEAKQSLTSYIPQYKEKMEDRGRDSRNEQRTTMLTSDVNTRRENAPVVNIEIENRYEEESTVSKNQQTSCKLQESKLRETADSEKEETRSHISGNTELTTRVSEKSHSAKAEDFRNIEQKSVEKSADGSVQIQRKRVVTEEMEHTRKSTEIVIEKNTSTTNQQGFRNVRNPEEDNPHVIGMHVTAPNPIRSPFLKSTQEVTPPTLGTVCQKVGKHVECPPKVEEVCSTPCFPKFDATTLPRPKTIPEVSDAKVEETKPAPKPIKHVNAPGSSRIDQKLNPNVPPSDVGVGGGRQSGAVGVAPKRGRGVLNAAQLGGRIALCGQCHGQIRGPFITALGKIWCPNHFICATPSCRRPLQDMGFVEEQGQLYCEYCFEQYLAPICAKCGSKIKGDCLKAIGKGFHPECFNCSHCGKLFGNSPFFLEDGSPYCEADWNELFTTKCFACGFPVEAGDRWVEALNNNYHSQCFNCTMCKKNLEGQSFFAKGGRPYCRNHAR